VESLAKKETTKEKGEKMNSIWQEIKQFFKSPNTRRKKNWRHITDRKIEIMLYYCADTLQLKSDYTCRYKTVSGKVSKKYHKRSGDYKKVIIHPRTHKATILVWKKYTQASGGGTERYVVHLVKGHKGTHYQI